MANKWLSPHRGKEQTGFEMQLRANLLGLFVGLFLLNLNCMEDPHSWRAMAKCSLTVLLVEVSRFLECLANGIRQQQRQAQPGLVPNQRLLLVIFKPVSCQVALNMKPDLKGSCHWNVSLCSQHFYGQTGELLWQPWKKTKAAQRFGLVMRIIEREKFFLFKGLSWNVKKSGCLQMLVLSWGWAWFRGRVQNTARIVWCHSATASLTLPMPTNQMAAPLPALASKSLLGRK